MNAKAAVTSDFVEIDLSPAGVTFAGKGGVVKISNGHFSYAVASGKTVRVLTSEWSRVLSKETYAGQPIFQVAGSTTNSPQTQLSALKAQESVLENEIAQEGSK